MREPAEILKARRSRVLLARGYRHLLLRVAALAVLVWLLLSQVFLVTRTRGNEMAPALKDGDLTIAFRLQGDYSKNDVVVYRADGAQRVGSVAARAGDVVMLDGTGTMRVNGTTQAGDILYPTYATGELTYPYTVPEDSLFILGDHRTQAEDSRSFGAVTQDDVEGKVISILRRRGL